MTLWESGPLDPATATAARDEAHVTSAFLAPWLRDHAFAADDDAAAAATAAPATPFPKNLLHKNAAAIVTMGDVCESVLLWGKRRTNTPT